MKYYLLVSILCLLYLGKKQTRQILDVTFQNDLQVNVSTPVDI